MKSWGRWGWEVGRGAEDFFLREGLVPGGERRHRRVVRRPHQPHTLPPSSGTLGPSPGDVLCLFQVSQSPVCPEGQSNNRSQGVFV